VLLPPLDGKALDLDEGDKLWVLISAVLVQKKPRSFAQGLGQFLRSVAQGQVHHALEKMKVLAAVDIADGGVLSALQNDARRIACNLGRVLRPITGFRYNIPNYTS